MYLTSALISLESDIHATNLIILIVPLIYRLRKLRIYSFQNRKINIGYRIVINREL